MIVPAQITHIEIRRVQNGFVVMGFNFSMDHTMYEAQPANVLAMVATDAKALGALVENFANGAEVGWLPSAELPLVDMRRRTKDE